MHKITSLLIVVAASVSRADVAQDVERANKAVRAVGQPASPCSGCSVALAGDAVGPVVAALARTCVARICGTNPVTIASVVHSIFVSDSSAAADYAAKVTPVLKEMAMIDRQATARYLEILEPWLKSNAEVSEPVVVRFTNLMREMEFFSKFKFKAEGQTVVVDETASREALKSLAQPDYDKHLEVARYMLKAFVDGANRLPTDVETLKLLPRSVYEQKVKAALSLLGSTEQMMTSNPELSLFTNIGNFREAFDAEKYRERLLGAEIDSYALVQVNQNLGTAKLLVSMATDPEFKKLLDGPPIRAKDLAADPKVAAGIAVLRGRGASPIDFAVAPKCYLAAMTANAALPSTAELEKFKPRVPRLKSKFKDLVATFTSKESAGKLAPKIDAWTPNLPRSREKFSEILQSNLLRKRDSLRSGAKSQDDMLSSPKRDAYFVLMASSLRQKDASEIELDAIDDTCKEMVPNILPDAAMPLYGTFSIGPIVVSHSPDFDAITMHEMGHLLNMEMNIGPLSPKTSGWYQSTKACFKGAQAEGEKYFSEDFADMVAAKSSDRNVACLFMPGGSAPDFGSLSLANPSKTDTHSSDFMRLLQTERYKTGTVPSECLIAYQAKGETFPSKMCGGSSN